MLLTFLLSLLIALLAWGFWRTHGRSSSDDRAGVRDDFLLWLLVIGSLSLGAFLTLIILDGPF